MKNKHPVLRRFMRRKVSVVAAAVLILFVLIAILGPLVWQVDPLKQSVMKKYGPMTVQHPLGTDNLGRDTLARMIYGARVSLAISFAGVLSGALIGVLLGVSAGYFGRCDYQPVHRHPAGVPRFAAGDYHRRGAGTGFGQHRHCHYDIYHTGLDTHGAKCRAEPEKLGICRGVQDDGRK